MSFVASATREITIDDYTNVYKKTINDLSAFGWDR
jgi:hypothetical protein